MRWEYASGKLFISDGKFIYSYYPDEHRAEKMSMKETDDMRAPLAFLLGDVDFDGTSANTIPSPRMAAC